MQVLNIIRKFLLLFCIVSVVSLTGVSNLYAQGDTSTNSSGGAGAGGNPSASPNSSSNYLYYIMIYTYGALQRLNQLPNYFNNMGQFIKSWMDPDTSKATTQIQGDFANLGKSILQNESTQNNAQTQLIIDLLTTSAKTVIKMQPGQPANTTINQLATVMSNFNSNINDISYATLVGTPPAPKVVTKSSPYNYIKNAAGVTLYHVIPSNSWGGLPIDRTKYQNYFNTVTSIESYGGYILSNLVADLQNPHPVSSVQTNLIKQASSSAWIAQIAGKAELGTVLRQLLMYTSQSYVLLTEMLRVQRQMLVAQVMTNAAILSTSQNAEQLLVMKAQNPNS